MYAKIFTQIFDSSIAENYKVRHVFEDLLKLADREGVVDMTAEAISRRTNVPLEEVKAGIEELMKADERSRSRESDGKRLLLVDSRRDWGWQIVNYAHYRALQDEETRREYFRNAKRKERAGKPKRVKKAKGLPGEPLAGEAQYIRALENEGQAAADAVVEREFADQTPWESEKGDGLDVQLDP